MYYIPSFKDVNKKFCSELRKESFPSCCIYTNNGRLLYKDFGNGDHYNIFSYVMKKFNVTYQESLQIIANDFNIITTNRLPTQLYFGCSQGIKVIEDKVKKEIKVKYRKWNLQDKSYWWDRYNLPSKLLNEYQVYPLEGHFYDGNYYKAKEITYGYYHFKDKWKIYKPLNEQGHKWAVGNFTKDLWCGYDQLSHFNDKLIITSSRKDTMCWRLLGFDAINPQSEHSSFDTVFIEGLKYRFKQIYINFDNDEQGIKATNQILKLHDFKSLYLPEHKDLSGYIWKEGLDKTKKLINGIFN